MPRPRCSRCLRPESHCLCALIPKLQNRTELLVLQDPHEAHHALNTARLAVLGLTRASLQVGEVFEELKPVVEAPGTWLLFPGDGAVDVHELARSDELPMRLIVPDGTWRKARRLLHLNPMLAALPRASLPEGVSSRYRIRKAPGPGALSTLEAIVLALNALETPADFSPLLKPFEQLIDGQISAMGEDVYLRHHQSPES